MSSVSPTNATTTPALSPERAKLREAAQGFEAIFVRQMLAAARTTTFGNDMFKEQGNETFTQMRDERFADIAAKSGAFGLAKQLEVQLAKTLPSTPLPSTTAKGG